MTRRLRRILTTVAVPAVLVAASIYVLGFRPLRDPHPPLRLGTGVLAIIDARIYASPDEPPIEHGIVLIRDGRITAAGRDVVVPAGAKLLACRGCTVTAGFWNAHVHFTEAKWAQADWKAAAVLDAQLATSSRVAASRPWSMRARTSGIRCRCAAASNPESCPDPSSTRPDPPSTRPKEYPYICATRCRNSSRC